MTREPPLNWVGVTFASSAPWTRVEDVVGDVEPELDEARADDRQQRGDQVERPVARGDQDARAATGTIVAVRNGRRVVRRVRNPNDSRGLTGVPRSADSASK